MKCPNCGNENDNGLFCSVCGTRLDTQTASGAHANSAPVYTTHVSAPPPPPPAYTAPQYNAAPYADERPLTTGQFFLLDLLMIIPLVNLILLFVWGFGNDNVNRKNWARAKLIWILVGIVLSILFSILLVSVFASLGDNLGDFFYSYM